MSAENSATIPVFPLPLVVAPGEAVALHIFEPRYKEMIARCRREKEAGAPGAFVIAWWDGSSVADTGGVMTIEKVTKEHEDGQLDLVARCQERCRILEHKQEASYRTARTVRVTDTREDWSEELATQVFELHRELLRATTGASPMEAFYSGHTSLSFRILPTSGIDVNVKQLILEMTNENERLEALRIHLEQTLGRIKDALGAILEIQTAWRMYDESGPS